MNRARTIVRLAASKTEVPFARAWLLDDPRGDWERRAGEYLERFLAGDDVNGKIATVLVYLALESMRRSM